VVAVLELARVAAFAAAGRCGRSERAGDELVEIVPYSTSSLSSCGRSVEISVNASEEIETERVKDLETLRRHASDLRRKADAATQTYDRTAWIRFAAIFVPIHPHGTLGLLPVSRNGQRHLT